jgi:HlyD family secretion protein
MTATLDVMTERRDRVLHLPIQCVTMRPKPDAKGGPAKEGDKKHAGRERHEGGGPREAMADPAPAPRSGGGGMASNLREVVYVVRDGVAREIPVETGISSPTHIEIVGGELKEGDEVVSGNYRVLARELADGDRVKVDNESVRRSGSGNDRDESHAGGRSEGSDG